MPLLADMDYDSEKHDAAIEAIRARNLPNITEIIEAVVELYDKLYQVDAYNINCGLCEDFAADVCGLVPEAVAEWGDGFISEGEDADKYAYHCLIWYGGRFYDSQHPEGVDDFRQISAFH